MKRLILVSGFLGVGKTTIIKKIINTMNSENRIALIENEFGTINIDKESFKDYRLDIKEINSGCICCSLKGDFRKGILELESNYNPNIIFIEPSGIADTSNILNIFLEMKESYTLSSIMVINYNTHFLYLENFKDFYKSQILSSNIILTNRCKDKKNIRKYINSIMEINDSSNIYFEPFENSFKDIINQEFNFDKYIHIDNSRSKQDYQSLSLVVSKSKNKNEILYKLKKIAEDKSVYRIKGIIKLLDDCSFRIDYTRDISEKIFFERINYNGIGKFVFIGQKMNEKFIKDLICN